MSLWSRSLLILALWALLGCGDGTSPGEDLGLGEDGGPTDVAPQTDGFTQTLQDRHLASDHVAQQDLAPPKDLLSPDQAPQDGPWGEDLAAPSDAPASDGPTDPQDRPLPMDDGSDHGDDLPGQGCCEPPLVLDPTRGICIDPTSIGIPCSDIPYSCGFGEMCVTEWGEGPIGNFCHMPCSESTRYQCPEGYVCSPARCCDFPDRGCIPDPCEPPLRYHPGFETCVSVQGLDDEDCSEGGKVCGQGQECQAWMGIGGEVFHTCILPCSQLPRLCPNGFHCTDWEDGPENSCTALGPWELRGCDDPQALTCGVEDKLQGVDRLTMCPECQGLWLCVEPGAESLIRTTIPEVDIDCDRPDGPCGSQATSCLFPLRPGVVDCLNHKPSDFYWSSVCVLASVEEVSQVICREGP